VKIKSRNVKHKFEWTSEYSGTCGDHYCPGHYHDSVKCLCGWTKKFSHEVEDKEKVMLEHRLAYLEGKIA
jgi:hypothetical protein